LPNVAVTSEVQPVKEASIEATVVRCGCDDPMSHAILQLPCPTPRATEPLGVVSYWHKNPLRRLAWHVKQGWKEGRV
jgi:hypothetical protein